LPTSLFEDAAEDRLANHVLGALVVGSRGVGPALVQALVSSAATHGPRGKVVLVP
jgi:hypothetical protein